MRGAISFALACAIALALAAPALAAEPLTAAEVITKAEDGDRVVIRGEAIGDILDAERGHKWVNVLSGGMAVGLWMSDSDAEKIDTLGNYDFEGDQIEASGIFNTACDLHQGDTDTHVESLRVVDEGAAREQPVHPWKAVVALLLAVVASGFAVWYRREVRRVE